MDFNFSHSYIDLEIVDNSAISDITDGGALAGLFPYFSDKGNDSKIERIVNLGTFLKKSGKPNFRRHGQPIYNLINYLTSQGRVYGRRLTAENASYANLVLNIKTKPVDLPVYKTDAKGKYILDANGNKQELDVPSTTKGVLIKIEAETLPDILNKEMFSSALDTGLNVPDADGFQSHRVFGFLPIGRGKAYNKLSLKMSLDTKLAETYDAFRLYNFKLSETAQSGAIATVDEFMVSTLPEAKSLTQSSFFLKQVVSNISDTIEALFSEKAYDDLISDIMEATKVNGDYTITQPALIDFLFGKDFTLEQDSANIKIDPTSVNLESLTGVYFGSGTDGDLDTDTKTLAEINATKVKLLYDFFTGVIDRKVFDKDEVDAKLIFDANYPVEVKEAIDKLCDIRKDIFAFLDTNFMPNLKTTLAWRASEYQRSSFYSAIFAHSFVVSDVYNLVDIPVTTTYELAGRLPSHVSNYGIHKPFVGPNRGIISGFKSLDWTPADEYEKEDLYKARINYIEQDSKQTRYMMQLTSQSKRTALSNINNVLVLLDIGSIIRKISKGYPFEYATSDVLKNFQNDCVSGTKKYLDNGACKRINISVIQKDQDNELGIVRVILDIAFNNLIERIGISLQVGK